MPYVIKPENHQIHFVWIDRGKIWYHFVSRVWNASLSFRSRVGGFAALDTYQYSWWTRRQRFLYAEFHLKMKLSDLNTYIFQKIRFSSNFHFQVYNEKFKLKSFIFKWNSTYSKRWRRVHHEFWYVSRATNPPTLDLKESEAFHTRETK